MINAWLRRAACAALFAMAMAVGQTQAGERLTVVELFTSQGCMSCPPAEAFLQELAARPDIIALEFHVDYWDYIGWKDPYADPRNTARQKAYARALGARMVYTPQMVIDGRAETAGSDRPKVMKLIEEARALASTPVDVTVAIDHDGYPMVLVGAKGPKQAIGALVTCYLFDRERLTDVARGENQGKRLKNTHMVIETHLVGRWSQSKMYKRLPIEPDRLRAHGGVAVVVQSPHGVVYGAAILKNDPDAATN